MSEEACYHEWDTHCADGVPKWLLAGDWMREGYCPTCGTRLNADGTVTPMVPAVTNEAVRETFFFGNLSDWSRQWGVMLNGTESTPEMKEMPVNISLHVGDVPIILSALQQSGAGDRAARWLAKKYGDLLRCVPHPYGWACDNCFVAGICGKKYRETGVATTGDECDGVVLAAAYATAGEPPPGPDAEDFIDHRFSQPIPIIQELADDLRATPTGVPFRAAGEPPPGPDALLNALQVEVGEWVRYNFGNAPMLDQAAVVCEEAGELIHHVLKHKQGIRAEEGHEAGMIDAAADVVIAVCAFASIAGFNLGEVVCSTWAIVKQRDWTKARALLAGQNPAPEAGSGATRNEED